MLGVLSRIFVNNVTFWPVYISCNQNCFEESNLFVIEQFCGVVPN